MKTVAGDAVGRIVGQMMSEIFAPAIIVLLITAALVYLVPTIIAFIKRRRDRVGILLFNVFWGWTVIGWFIALSRALKKSRSSKKSTRRKSAARKRSRSKKG